MTVQPQYSTSGDSVMQHNSLTFSPSFFMTSTSSCLSPNTVQEGITYSPWPG